MLANVLGFFFPINNSVTDCRATVDTGQGSTLGGDSGEAREQEHMVQRLIQTRFASPTLEFALRIRSAIIPKYFSLFERHFKKKETLSNMLRGVVALIF